MRILDKIFFYTLLLFTVLLVAVSFYRFIVIQDYIVSYEGMCDPYTENCFYGCEDDACTEEYYYTLIQRQAVDIYNLCGQDITSCEAANYCTADEANCSVSYCDPLVDGELCETLEEADGSSGETTVMHDTIL